MSATAMRTECANMRRRGPVGLRKVNWAAERADHLASTIGVERVTAIRIRGNATAHEVHDALMWAVIADCVAAMDAEPVGSARRDYLRRAGQLLVADAAA